MSDRERMLAEVLRHYGIEADYNDEADASHEFVAIATDVADGEQAAAGGFDSLEAACEWLAEAYRGENTREPAIVVDLETGEKYQPEIEMFVRLKPVT